MVQKLDQRIAALTGLNVHPPYAEYLQVVNYGIGGHYEPHFDHATVSTSRSLDILNIEALLIELVFISNVSVE